MKKAAIIFFVFFCFLTKAQITQVNYSYNNSTGDERHLVKLGLNGYKYFRTIYTGSTYKLEIYNLNNTLHALVPFPSSYTSQPNIYYISDNLFNSDTLIEFCVVDYSTTAYPMGRLYIANQSGATLFSRDSCNFGSFYVQGIDEIFDNSENIFFDGISTKMRIVKCNNSNCTSQTFFYYNLPGNIPCSDCTAGVITGLVTPSQQNGNNYTNATFFPNPVFSSDNLKLDYKIPENTKLAQIKVYDMTGKLIETFRISPSTDHILLPSSFNNGLYVYTLETDGVTIKSEKIILNK